MRKKSVIFGLVLLFAGTAALSWCLTEKRKEQQQAASYKLKHSLEADEYLQQYNQWLKSDPEQRGQLPWGLDKYGKTKPAAQLRQEQRERLKADLDKLAAGETDVYPFADVLYGANWQKELAKYKKRKEMVELALSCSILCMLTGGAIFSWWLLSRTVRLVIRSFCSLKEFSTDYLERGRKGKSAQRWEAEEQEGELESRNGPGFGQDKGAKVEAANSVSERLSHLEEPLRALRKSGWQSFNGGPAREKERLRIASAKNGRRTGKTNKRASSAKKAAVPLCDENSGESEELLKAGTESPKLNAMQPGEPAERALLHLGNAEQMTQAAQQAAVEHSEPLNNTLIELTQEVAAIREYARQQQDRVKKLQDGYDWNIIRNFCLRIIRCIDNLENRIAQLCKQDIETINLEAARDELVFALESSGVEQFEPEINSDYRGQERRAEAVRDKQRCNKPNMTGKIAKVIRPGYQYVIDEENTKVVRTAQVKIYN